MDTEAVAELWAWQIVKRYQARPGPERLFVSHH